MSLALYAHPFSSYVHKALIALYENATPFTLKMLDSGEALAELKGLWPIGLMPVLVDSGRAVAEASIIIEHLQLNHPGPVRLIPEDPRAALEARFLDRVFDNHVQTPFQKIVGDALRPEGERDPRGVSEARQRLETAYAWLDAHMAGREWACGDGFTLADVSAAPALFYGDWIHPIDPAHANLHAYRARLNARPSYARVIDEARPYRPLFPLGATDRD